MPMLRSDRIVIKPLEKKYLEKIRNLRNDSATNYFLSSIIPISESMQEEWFRKLSLDSTRMYFSIEDKKGNFLGYVRCDEWDKVNRSIRIGIDIALLERKKGYASEAYALLFDYMFRELSINRIWLLVADYNKVALNLYRKLGFKTEGRQREAIFRDNKFNDYIQMSIIKEEYDSR